MGIFYRHTSRMTVDVWNGEIDDEIAAEHLKKLAADPDWGVQGLILTDLTGVNDDSRPSPESILQIGTTFVENMGERVRDAKWAVVADVTFEDATRFGEYVAEKAPRLIVFNDL